MSAVCVLTPLVIAAWPAFSAAVVAAAASMGYQVVAGGVEAVATIRQANTVQLEIARSEVVTSQLARDQRITVMRNGVTVTFSRDVRGRASLCVTGEGHTKAELKALGEELSQIVVQQYVYQKITEEMRSRGFVVVDEQTNEDRSIHLKVRHWET